MKKTRLLFFVRRVGPYHDARFEAAGSGLDLVVVETRPGSTEYPWTTAAGASRYQLAAFRPASIPEQGWRGAELESEVERMLQTHRPEVVASAGWADPEYHVLLQRCHALGTPAIVMSDSTFEDEPRRWWKEWIKASLVRSYAAAVVAGARSRDYLVRLGFPAPAIFQPWDVVDNRHFADGANRERERDRSPSADGATRPQRFLCVARFIPKKNLEGLVRAYAAYVAEFGAEAWDLVLSGSGPLEAALRAQVSAAGLASRVGFAGFRQYPDLPEAYAAASALVLPSWSDQWGLVVNEAMAAGLPVVVSGRCGCVVDLVRDGVNGLVFDPSDPAALKSALVSMTRLEPAQRLEMGRRAREIIAIYSPESFGAALAEAASCALRRRDRRTSQWSRAVVGLLATRRGSVQ